ncbi:MAG: hypothetical protein ACK4OP_04695 [Gemmobacter sp.]
MVRSSAFAGACLLVLSGFPASADLSADIAARGLAATEAALTAEASPDDAARLGLAGVRFLRGIERALQTRWTHGIAAERTEIPVLRLPIPPNAAPEPFTPDLIAALFAALHGDMTSVQSVLAPLPAGDFGVSLRLGDLWFDIDGNGARGPGEDVLAVAGLTLSPAGLRRPGIALADVTVRFDAADAAWLLAYSHLLRAVAETVLALDTETAIAGVLADAQALAALREGAAPVNALDTLFGAQADRLLILWRALAQQPDPARTRAARADLLAMIAANRIFWARVAAETDDRDEWIPNDRQSAALGFVLPPGTGAHWLAVLDEAEAVLRGTRLVPHWRMGGGAGINLARLLDDPRPVDPAEWVHGAGLLPYAERGERMSVESWRDFERLLRGDAALFALLLN